MAGITVAIRKNRAKPQPLTCTHIRLHGMLLASLQCSHHPLLHTLPYIPSPNGANPLNMTHAIHHMSLRDTYVLACEIFWEATAKDDIYAMLIAMAGIQAAQHAIPIA